MKEDKEVYSIGLSILKGVDAVIVKGFAEAGIEPDEIFRLDRSELKSALGLSHTPEWCEKLARESALAEGRRQWEQMKRHMVNALSLLDPDYPERLFEIPDPPVVIYTLGEANLNAMHQASVVGTRKPTPYGIKFCESLVKELSEYFPDLSIVSGLAYGIDACAHKSSLANNVTTIAVVAHGLNMIYPAPHRQLAKEILRKGGAIISEYRFNEKPFRQRFLERNRIVAALSDVTVVVESDIKGGAMSTANTAFSYSREVMALPGKITDSTSRGCNHLIRKGKAGLITCAADLIETTGWQPETLIIDSSKRNLFPELEGTAKIVYDTLRFQDEPVQTDRLHQLTRIPMPQLLSLLGELEFDGVVMRHPGNRFSIS